MSYSPECLIDCRSACCTNIFVRLSDPEAGDFLEKGSVMQRKDQFGVEDGRRMWAVELCGFLRGILCWAKKVNKQPHKCKVLEPGSEGCLDARYRKPDLVVNWTEADRQWARLRQ